MKYYMAERKPLGPVVTVNQEGEWDYTLPHICRHSPDGFEWGYGGSGPADLALSMLTDAVGAELAERHYQRFKSQFIASQPFEGFCISSALVQAWIDGEEHREKGESHENQV